MSSKQRYYPKHRRVAVPGPSPLAKVVSQPDRTIVVSTSDDSGKRFESSILVNAASGSADIVALGDVRTTSMVGAISFYNQDTCVAAIRDDALIVTGGLVNPETVDPRGDVAVFIGDVSATRLRLQGREVKVTEIYHLWSNQRDIVGTSVCLDGIRDVTNYGSVRLASGNFSVIPGTYEIQVKSKIPTKIVDAKGGTVYMQTFNGINHYEMIGVLATLTETTYGLEIRQDSTVDSSDVGPIYAFVHIVKID